MNKKIQRRIEREKLFQQVWKTSIVELAKQYGVSDVGLVKICKKLNVPRPPRGYWLKKRRGNPPNLPPTKGPTYHDLPPDRPEPVTPEFSDLRTQGLSDYATQPNNNFKARKTLRDPHPLVQETKQQLSTMRPNHHNRYKTWQPGILSVNVCKGSIHRALTILDTLIKALTKRGFPVFIASGNVKIEILEEELAVKI